MAPSIGNSSKHNKMASPTMSKESYLKRYLSGDVADGGKKKKRRKKLSCDLRFKSKNSSSSLRIVDDDVDLWKHTSSLKSTKGSSDEEAPIVAQVIDDRPLEIRGKEFYSNEKWRNLEKDNGDSSSSSRKRHDSDSDGSIEVGKRHDSDLSDSSDEGEQRKSRNSESDQPPVRNRQDSDDDHSLVRQSKASDSDQSPVRKSRNSDSDQSPVRINRGSDSDLSPVRKPIDDAQLSTNTQILETNKKRTKTLGGAKAGLQDAKSLREEIKTLRKKENEMFAENPDEFAETQFRKSAKLKHKEDRMKKEEKEKNEAILKEKYTKWNKGLKQAEMQSDHLESALHEMSKPLARYEGDQDLERELKEKVEIEDPMYKYMQKKRQKSVQKQLKGKPMYLGLAPPPARFSIRPGYRWDGVDRSNGFENKIIMKKTSIEARVDEAYKWSVEDM